MAIRLQSQWPPVQWTTDAPLTTALPRGTGWQWQSFQWGLLLLFVWPMVGGILLGVAKLGLIKRFWARWSSHPLVQLWGVLFLLMLGASMLAIAPLEALLGMANLIPFGLLVTVLVYLLRTPAQLRRLSRILVLAALPMLLLGFGQLFGNWSTPEGWEAFWGWSLVAGGNPPGRMAAMLMYANLLSCYLLVIGCLTTGLWLEVYRQWRQQPTPALSWQLGSWTLALLGLGLGVFLTHSRNAWGLAIVAFLSLCAYVGWLWLIALVGVGIGVVAWATWLPAWGGNILRQIVPYLIWGRLSGEMYPDEQTEILRSVQWRFCWQLIQERPWTGWGLRSFEPLYNYGEHAITHFHWIAHPHNLLVMLGAELGLPLTLALCVWVAACLLPLVRRFHRFPERDRPLLFSYLLAFGMVFGFNLLDVSLFDFRTNFLGWLLLGAIAGVGRSNPGSSVDS
ncbi:MAG: O-antigen ligase family protein [Spirulinaceae cyanobacterium]